MEDREILTLLIQKEQSGLEGLSERYGGMMHYIIRGILSDPREQEECLSDVTLKVWNGAGQFDPEKGSLATWLTAITRNTALNRLEAHRRQESRQTELDETQPDRGEGPEEAVLRQERAAQLKEALNRLTWKDRALFYRKYYYLQSTAQMAAELGMTERAVEGRLYRLRLRLRQWLGGEEHA